MLQFQQICPKMRFPKHYFIRQTCFAFDWHSLFDCAEAFLCPVSMSLDKKMSHFKYFGKGVLQQALALDDQWGSPRQLQLANEETLRPRRETRRRQMPRPRGKSVIPQGLQELQSAPCHSSQAGCPKLAQGSPHLPPGLAPPSLENHRRPSFASRFMKAFLGGGGGTRD